MADLTFFDVMSRSVAPRQKTLSAVSENRGGWFRVFESFAGAWQRNIEVNHSNVLAYPAVYACQTLIASDIAKLRIKLVKKDGGIWSETANPAYSPVLRKPNHFQNRIQFIESWILSKLARGNTYVLKARDARNVVVALYVLDPNRVQTLVSDEGSVFYQLSSDNVAGLTGDVTVPAREIIHDRMNCLFHPLVGTSPIFAAGLAATHGHQIQVSSANFFKNQARPSGFLTAPAHIPTETADRLKESWDQNYGGENLGKLAVLGDGLKFEKMTLTAVEAQMIDQLKWSDTVICSTHHVPPYKIGIGEMPKYDNIQALNVEYYSQCLQVLIESIELCLDEGLGIGDEFGIGTEFDLDGLLRMDSVTQMEMLDKGKNTFTPNEARSKVGLPKVPGGDSVYRQQQDYSLEALAKRDAMDDPFGKSAPATPVQNSANDNLDAQADKALLEIMKGLA